jgi:hypothetical protein
MKTEIFYLKKGENSRLKPTSNNRKEFNAWDWILEGFVFSSNLNITIKKVLQRNLRLRLKILIYPQTTPFVGEGVKICMHHKLFDHIGSPKNLIILSPLIKKTNWRTGGLLLHPVPILYIILSFWSWGKLSVV